MRIALMPFVILVTVWLGTNGTDLSSGSEASTVLGGSRVTCLNDREVSNAIRGLASGNESQVDRARAMLVNKAKLSPTCRGEVVTTLMKAMDKPNLDFNRDKSTYYLWLYGASLLGNLRAAEALDLLISHLNLAHHIYSSSMNHQPALLGVLRMGPIAIPKLGEVLRHNPDPKMRYSAVYCLATIGGDSAVEELKAALGSESDECGKRLIRVSLDSFDNEGHIKNRMQWFSGFSCNK